MQNSCWHTQWGSIFSTYIPWTSTKIKRSLGKYYLGDFSSATPSWSWQPPKTLSCIHIRHMYAIVHGHTSGAAWHSYPPLINSFWVAYVDSKWCKYIMYESEKIISKVLPHRLDIYKVFELVDILHSYTFITFLRLTNPPQTAYGMVQAWVGQKLINVTFYEFFRWPIL